MKAYVLGAIGAAALLAAGGLAHAASQPLVAADIPFQFTVAGQTLPAGNYEISATGDYSEVLEFREAKTGKVALVEPTTRLANRNNGQNTLVFDEAGGQPVLSEMHLETADGYYFAGMKAKHTHRSIAAKRKS